MKLAYLIIISWAKKANTAVKLRIYVTVPFKSYIHVTKIHLFINIKGFLIQLSYYKINWKHSKYGLQIRNVDHCAIIILDYINIIYIHIYTKLISVRNDLVVIDRNNDRIWLPNGKYF